MAGAIARYGRPAVLRAARDAASTLRKVVLAGGQAPPELAAWLEAESGRLMEEAGRPSLVRVINATGVLLHTNLGRAPLGREIVERAARRAAGFCNLEMDLQTGTRGSRLTHVQKHLRTLYPSSGSLVVNNNAAAVLLILNTLAQDREVIVSRGELVEIGGSFRIPDICARSGARLVEVGTTNRTRLADYRRVITKQTAMLLKVHPSNFRVVGFTEEVDPGDLAALGRSKRITVVADLGSGTVVDLPAEFSREPSPSTYLRLGYGLVCFSGDKMLGACQAGIIIGRPRLIDALKRNPLYRALRPDKLSLAVLEETLMSLRTGSDQVPLLQMLSMPLAEIEARARQIMEAVRDLAAVEIHAGESLVGGGSAADLRVPTMLLSARPRGISDTRVLAALRKSEPPVIARAEKGRVLVDLRTVRPDEDAELLSSLRAALCSR